MEYETLSTSVKFTVKTMAQFGELFWSQAGIHTRESFHDLVSKDWHIVLAWFLKNYAFERQGSSPRYPIAADEAIQEYESDTPKDDFEQSVWQEFQRGIEASHRDKGVNDRRNPLAPSSQDQGSITALVAGLNLNNYNLIRWAKEGLRNGHVKDVYGELQKVRGLGPKIISLFLRDIATAFEMNEFDLEPAKYLQPIDVWTRRGAQILAGRLQKPEPKHDEACATIIVESSRIANVRPSLVNAGLWIFGAQFAQTEQKFLKVLSTSNALCRFLAEQKEIYTARADFLAKCCIPADSILEPVST